MPVCNRLIIIIGIYGRKKSATLFLIQNVTLLLNLNGVKI